MSKQRGRAGLLQGSIFLFLLLGAVARTCAADALDQIKQRGVLRWGADAEGGAPYTYPDPQKPDQIIGFEYDLAEALAAKLGVKAEMVQNQWDQLIPGLERGNFDIVLNGLEVTEENQQRNVLTQPYYVYAQQIVTRKGNRDILGPDDLRRKTVGVLSASAALRLIAKIDGVDMRVYPGNVEALRDLKAYRIEAAVMDLPIAIYYAKPDPALQFAGPSFAQGYYTIGVRRKDSTLLVALNKAIQELAQDGTLERIYRKYNVWDERRAERFPT